jgi:hypothetical protein
MNTQTAHTAYQKLLRTLSKSKKSRPTVVRIRKIVENDVAKILDGIPDQALIGIGAEGRVVSSHYDNHSIHHWVFNTFGECTYNRY